MRGLKNGTQTNLILFILCQFKLVYKKVFRVVLCCRILYYYFSDKLQKPYNFTPYACNIPRTVDSFVTPRTILILIMHAATFEVSSIISKSDLRSSVSVLENLSIDILIKWSPGPETEPEWRHPDNFHFTWCIRMLLQTANTFYIYQLLIDWTEIENCYAGFS